MPASLIKGREEKGGCVREILLGLPERFGLPESAGKYIEESSRLPLWCEKKREGYLDSITLSQTSEDAAEIYFIVREQKKTIIIEDQEQNFLKRQKVTQQNITDICK